MIQVPLHLSELQQAAVKSVGWYYDLAANKLGIHLPYPRVSFGLTGAVAGKAFTARNYIELNNRFLHTNTENFLKQTCGHEAAHIFNYAKYHGKASPHGREWAGIMWTFGLPSDRCHNYLGGKDPNREIVCENANGRKVTYLRGTRMTEVEL